MLIFPLLALQAAQNEILVTASRPPVAETQSGVSSTIIDAQRIDALGEAQAIDLLRLAPDVSVSVSGARGSQAQVRIRGAEANHTLLFLDGIDFNDPAAGNEPRFETLVADGLSRIEVVRGPQSALWGSEAIGGVVALETPDPTTGTRITATGEYGSLDSSRLAAAGSFGTEHAGVAITAAHLASDGIDILGGGSGDKDGFRNTTASLKAIARPGEHGEIGIVARYIDAYDQFDGTDPVTFLRADTRDNSTTRTGAVRAYATLGTDRKLPWTFTIDGQYLASDNRNRNGDTPLNRTRGDRFRVSGQLERRLALGATHHELIAAVESEGESFHARDQDNLGATDQDRTRGHTAYVGEWRADWADRFSTDLAVRRDDFNRFRGATTLRGTAVAKLGGGFALTGAYGEGIAQPTFFDLYGFFPGSFLGNPALRPERSRGYEAGLRWQEGAAGASITAFDDRLRDEIVPTFDSATFISSTANVSGTSKRRGIELEAQAQPLHGLRLSANYTYLDASDQQVAGAVRLKEVRRPKHSGNAALDYSAGQLTVGSSLSYVGKRRDTDFDIGRDVTLHDYLLASLRIAWRVMRSVEAYARVDNAFDADYQDVAGYATPGRTIYAGLRFRLGN